MSREYNNQGIHEAEKNLDKAKKQLKRWGGKEEMRKYIEKRDELDKEYEVARRNEKLSKEWWGF